jgi:hypothetical protein
VAALPFSKRPLALSSYEMTATVGQDLCPSRHSRERPDRTPSKCDSKCGGKRLAMRQRQPRSSGRHDQVRGFAGDTADRDDDRL